MDVVDLRKNFKEHWEKATAIRMLSIDAVQKANSGHPGMPMGMADVCTVLFKNHLKFDPNDPDWPDRDRFILSAGHGSMLLYSILYLTGYKDISLDDIKNFRQIGSKTAGHPEFGHIKGIETTTGPLGQGLATGVGMAIAELILRKKWGKNLVDHKTYVLAGDGCLMEGISQESITLAGKHELSNLIVLWDNNGITIDGEIHKSCVTNQIDRFKSSNWSTFECDGHNPNEIDDVISKAQESGVNRFSITGSSLNESISAIEIAKKFPNSCISTAGIHPHNAKEYSPSSFSEIRDLLEEDVVKSIGETGLDFYRNFSAAKQQELSFEAHLELAIETRYPLFLHERDAHKRFIEIISPLSLIHI